MCWLLKIHERQNLHCQVKGMVGLSPQSSFLWHGSLSFRSVYFAFEYPVHPAHALGNTGFGKSAIGRLSACTHVSIAAKMQGTGRTVTCFAAFVCHVLSKQSIATCLCFPFFPFQVFVSMCAGLFYVAIAVLSVPYKAQQIAKLCSCRTVCAFEDGIDQ